jgi:hypothetical protein
VYHLTDFLSWTVMYCNSLPMHPASTFYFVLPYDRDAYFLSMSLNLEHYTGIQWLLF